MKWINRFLGKYGRIIQYFISFALYLQLIIVYAISAFPAVYGFLTLLERTQSFSLSWKALALSFGIFAGVAIFGFCLCMIVPILSYLSFARLKEGTYPLYSFETLQWAAYNTWILMVRFTVMNFIRNTPFYSLWIRMMGCKIGKNVQINTLVMADASLLEVGDNTVVGGDCTLICHAVEEGKLVLRRTKIGKNVTLGLMSIILPGVEIGDGASVGANSVVTKNCKIPENEIWAGNPARFIRKKSGKPSEINVSEASSDQANILIAD
ncbi:MAG: DapH/DapD/GlmU-related protein [Planctomycetota bacterium]